MHLKHTGEHRPGKTAPEMYFRERTPQNLNSWLTCQRPGREGWARILITSPAAVQAAAVTHFRLFLNNWNPQQTLYLQRKVTLFSLLKFYWTWREWFITQKQLVLKWQGLVHSIYVEQCLCSLWTCEGLVLKWQGLIHSTYKGSVCVHCEHVRSFGFFVFNSEPLITMLGMW